jgi:ribonuclease HII
LEKQPESPNAKRPASKPSARETRRWQVYEALEAFDRRFIRPGMTYLAGVDEVGRGALAGPVVAAAVILPPDSGLAGVRDSKKLSEENREVQYSLICDKALAVGVGVGTRERIDSENILNATLFAMVQAIGKLEIDPDVVIVDGRESVRCPAPVIPVVRGDGQSLSIGAASIVAKVTRDRLMRQLHETYPVYNFLKNKGYGTKEHLSAIVRHGRIPEHRITFRVKEIEKKAELF